MALRVGDLAHLYRAPQVFGQQFDDKSTEQEFALWDHPDKFQFVFHDVGKPGLSLLRLVVTTIVGCTSGCDLDVRLDFV